MALAMAREAHAISKAAVAMAVALGAGSVGCGATVEMAPVARALAPGVATVVALPTSVDFGGPGDHTVLVDPDAEGNIGDAEHGHQR